MCVSVGVWEVSEATGERLLLVVKVLVCVCVCCTAGVIPSLSSKQKDN